MSLSRPAATLRKCLLVIKDYKDAWLNFTPKPYLAMRDHVDSVHEAWFFTPRGAFEYVRGSLVGHGNIVTQREHFSLTRKAGKRNYWTMPAEFRARLGHQNVS